jgi:hypothetical protein
MPALLMSRLNIKERKFEGSLKLKILCFEFIGLRIIGERFKRGFQKKENVK